MNMERTKKEKMFTENEGINYYTQISYVCGILNFLLVWVYEGIR